MIADLRYLKTLLKHKWFVFVAARKLKQNNLSIGVPLWRLITHDASKFSRAEWGPYVRRFGSGNAGKEDKAADPKEFMAAFRHHWRQNPHHWEYWVKKGEAQIMPLTYVREMVADWMGAGRAYTGHWDIHEWYAKTKDRQNMHPWTRSYAEYLIDNVVL